MKAMIFAAGLGTRLKPLTNNKPKALVEIGGITLLEVVIRKLIFYDCKDIIINIHHFADDIIQFVHDNNSFGINILFSDEREKLLETGGGLKKAKHFFDDGKPFLVCNADVMTDLNIKELYKAHLNNNSIATIAVQNRSTSRYFLFDKNDDLCGWTNVKTGAIKMSKSIDIKTTKKLALSTTHIIDPKIFEYLPEADYFSMVDLYLEVAKHESIKAYVHDADLLMDIGKIEELDKAENAVENVLKSIQFLKNS
jgi:NDP-sugar pyrophosphorylase family protein